MNLSQVNETASKGICGHCGKPIKGKRVWHVPPQHLIALGIDSLRLFHPSCYKKETANAA